MSFFEKKGFIKMLMHNKRDFDAAAAKWDEKPRRVRLAQDIFAAMTTHLPISTEWDVMELGCGTGLLTLRLAPKVGNIVALDGAKGMLSRLEEKLREAQQTNVRTVHIDLERDELPKGPFHLVAAAMLLHHIPDPEPLIRSLRGVLHPGGWIALADLDAEDGSFHDDPTGLFHHGFSRDRMTELLTDAGFASVAVVNASEIIKGERRYPVLLTLGRR